MSIVAVTPATKVLRRDSLELHIVQDILRVTSAGNVTKAENLDSLSIDGRLKIDQSFGFCMIRKKHEGMGTLGKNTTDCKLGIAAPRIKRSNLSDASD